MDGNRTGGGLVHEQEYRRRLFDIDNGVDLSGCTRVASYLLNRYFNPFNVMLRRFRHLSHDIVQR